MKKIRILGLLVAMTLPGFATVANVQGTTTQEAHCPSAEEMSNLAEIALERNTNFQNNYGACMFSAPGDPPQDLDFVCPHDTLCIVLVGYDINTDTNKITFRIYDMTGGVGQKLYGYGVHMYYVPGYGVDNVYRDVCALVSRTHYYVGLYSFMFRREPPFDELNYVQAPGWPACANLPYATPIS